MSNTVSTSHPTAAIHNDTLVLTLPDAVNPVVWQFDLSSVRASALEVNNTDNGFTLRLKTPRGETHDIAVYEDRNRAVDVLMAVHRTLAGDGSVRVESVAVETMVSRTPANDSDYRAANWPLAACALLAFVTLYWIVASFLAPPQYFVKGASAPAAQMTQVPKSDVGKIQSADDVLKGRVP